MERPLLLRWSRANSPERNYPYSRMEASASSSALAPARGEPPPPREAASSPRAAPAARKEQRRHSMGERIREKSFRRGGGSTDHSSKYLARKFSSRDFAPRKGSVDLARAGGRPLDSPSFKSKEPTTPRRGSLDARGGADRRSHRRSTCTCSDADDEEVRSASPTKRAEAELPRFSTIIWEDTAAEQKSALSIDELMMKAQVRKYDRSVRRQNVQMLVLALAGIGLMMLQREIRLADGNGDGGAAAAELPIALANTAVTLSLLVCLCWYYKTQMRINHRLRKARRAASALSPVV